MKMSIIFCAVVAVVLSWFNWVFIVFIIGVPVGILTGWRYDLVYHIEGAQGQAGLIAWFLSLFPAFLSIVLFVRVFRWYRKEKTLISRKVWITSLVLFVMLPTINCVQNFHLYDTKNPPNVCVWDEQNKINQVVPRESVINDPRYVWDPKERTYRFAPKSK